MLESSPARVRTGALATALTALAATLLTIGTAQSATAATVPAYESIDLTVAPDSVEIGDTVTVTVDAEGLIDAYAYELSIDYDPSLLEFVTGSAVLPSGGFGSAEADGGTVVVIDTRLGTSPGLTGDQTLVTLEFVALAPGAATVALTSVELVDSDSVATPVDTSSPAFSASVTIADEPDDGAGTPPEGGADGEGGESPSGSTDGEEAGGGDLATTGADAVPWLIAGASAVALIGAGAVLALRRRRSA